MYGEDLDLCFRVSQEGLALYYLASEVIFHHEGAASKKERKSFAPVLQRAANYYFLRKNFGRTRRSSLSDSSLSGIRARLVAATLAIPLWILRRGPGQLAIPTFLGKYGDLFLWSVRSRRTCRIDESAFPSIDGRLFSNGCMGARFVSEDRDD